MVNCILGSGECNPNMDITQDENIDVFDIINVINIIIEDPSRTQQEINQSKKQLNRLQRELGLD